MFLAHDHPGHGPRLRRWRWRWPRQCRSCRPITFSEQGTNPLRQQDTYSLRQPAVHQQVTFHGVEQLAPNDQADGFQADHQTRHEANDSTIYSAHQADDSTIHSAHQADDSTIYSAHPANNTAIDQADFADDTASHEAHASEHQAIDPAFHEAGQRHLSKA